MNDSNTPSAIPALLAVVAFVLLAMPVRAGEFAVIVNKDNASPIDKEMVAKIYSGDLKSWKDGAPVMPIDLPESNPARASFSTEMLGKTVANVKALWAQMIFSGKALPPKQVAADDDVKKLVAANKGAIGYIKPSSVDESVRAALK
jgi:ABC-type phosphate transport system substrate-binding protein